MRRGVAGGPADADRPCADGRGTRGPTGLNQRPAHQEPARAPRGLSRAASPEGGACSPALEARGPRCPEAPRAGSLRCPVSARRKCRGQGEGSHPSAGGGGGQGPQKLPQASEVSALPPRRRPEPRSLHRLQSVTRGSEEPATWPSGLKKLQVAIIWASRRPRNDCCSLRLFARHSGLVRPLRPRRWLPVARQESSELLPHPPPAPFPSCVRLPVRERRS